MDWQFGLSLFSLCITIGLSISLILLFARITPRFPFLDNKLFLVFLVIILSQNLLILNFFLKHLTANSQFINSTLLSALDTSRIIMISDILVSVSFLWFSLAHTKASKKHYPFGAIIATIGLSGILVGIRLTTLEIAVISVLHTWSFVIIVTSKRENILKSFLIIPCLFLLETFLRCFFSLPLVFTLSLTAIALAILAYIIFWTTLTGRFIENFNSLNKEILAKEKAQIKIEKLNDELVKAYDTTLEGWAKALELKDRETEGHSRRVTDLSLSLARAMGRPDQEMVYIKYGALLHDIGKMGISDEILHKPEKLTIEERKMIMEHPTIAYNLLKDIKFLEKAIDIPYAHHERWDGNGYPRKLKGTAIPLTARLFAVVDTWDAITSDRSYDKARTQDEAIKELERGKGTQFDPDIVDVFIKTLR